MYYTTVVSEKVVATPRLFWIPKAFAWVYFSSEILGPTCKKYFVTNSITCAYHFFFHWLNTPVPFWRRRSLYLKRVALNNQRLMSLWPSSCIQSIWNRLGVNVWWGRKRECPEETLKVRLRSTQTQSTYNICSRGGRSDWFFSLWYVKWPSIRNQYPRDTAKPAGLKNDVNSKHSMEHKYATLNSTWVASLFNWRTINLPFLAYKQTGQFLKAIAGLIYFPVTDCQITA